MSRRMQNRIMRLWVAGWDPPAIALAVGRTEAYVADSLGEVRDRVSKDTARRIRKLREINVHQLAVLRARPVRVRQPASGQRVVNHEIQARSALQHRDDAIRTYLERGVPEVELALSFGLSPRTVRRIGREAA